MTDVSERHCARVYISKAKKNAKRFHIQKARHFLKIKTIFVMFLYTKSQTLYVTQFSITACSTYSRSE